jgi:hypothetical protein
MIQKEVFEQAAELAAQVHNEYYKGIPMSRESWPWPVEAMYSEFVFNYWDDPNLSVLDVASLLATEAQFAE